MIDPGHGGVDQGAVARNGTEEKMIVLAFARALLYRPDILFMDESSSALDNDTEAHLYQLLIDRLPECTVVSVAHRTTLEVFHPNTLHVAAPA